MDDYLKKFTLEQAGNIWHTDEQFINIKTKQKYIWNCMDNKTRFLLATHISNVRSTDNARELFQNAKRTAGKKATTVITDGVFAYEKAVKKEFMTCNNP